MPQIWFDGTGKLEAFSLPTGCVLRYIRGSNCLPWNGFAVLLVAFCSLSQRPTGCAIRGIFGALLDFCSDKDKGGFLLSSLLELISLRNPWAFQAPLYMKSRTIKELAKLDCSLIAIIVSLRYTSSGHPLFSSM